MTSPRTRKVPREKSAEVRLYCVATRSAIIWRCAIFSPFLIVKVIAE